VEPPNRQGECSREGGEHLCCPYILGHGWTPVYAYAYLVPADAFFITLFCRSCVYFFHANLPRSRGHQKDTHSFETHSDNSDSQKEQLTAVVQQAVP
jgi:hypothetical protein